MDSYIAEIDCSIKWLQIPVDEYLLEITGETNAVESYFDRHFVESCQRIKRYNESGGTIEWNEKDTFRADRFRFDSREDEYEEYLRMEPIRRMNRIDKKIEYLLK